MGDLLNAYLYPPCPQWTVVWGDSTYSATTAFEVLQEIGESSYAPMDAKYPKRGIAYRVFVQYRVLIDDDLPDELFLTRLAEFGIIQVSITGIMTEDILQQAVDFSDAWYGVGDKPTSTKGGE
jgi:hypothetical protein